MIEVLFIPVSDSFSRDTEEHGRRKKLANRILLLYSGRYDVTATPQPCFSIGNRLHPSVDQLMGMDDDDLDDYLLWTIA